MYGCVNHTPTTPIETSVTHNISPPHFYHKSFPLMGVILNGIFIFYMKHTLQTSKSFQIDGEIPTFHSFSHFKLFKKLDKKLFLFNGSDSLPTHPLLGMGVKLYYIR